MPSFKKAEVQKILEVDLQEDENDDGDDVENQDIFDISCKHQRLYLSLVLFTL